MKPRNLIVLITLLLVGCQNDDNKSPLQRQQEDFIASPLAWGYIGRDGQMIIPPQYDDARDFSHGRAAVMRAGAWGYIDTLGREIIAAQYMEAHPFYAGLARVRDAHGYYGLIDDQGRILFPYEWEELDDPQFAWFKGKKDGQYLLVNRDGEPLFQQVVHQLSSYNGKNAVATINEDVFLVTASGAFSPAYEQVVLTPSPPYPYKMGDQWGFLSESGEVVIPAQYDFVEPFTGKYTTGMQHDVYQCLDRGGRVIYTDSNEIEHLGYGLLARYGDDTESCVLIDTAGHSVLKDSVDEVHAFQEGRAAFRMGEQWSFLDSSGQAIVPPSYHLVWPFQNGWARVALNQSIGFIDKSGQLVLDKGYFEVKDFSNEGLARIQQFR